MNRVLVILMGILTFLPFICFLGFLFTITIHVFDPFFFTFSSELLDSTLNLLDRWSNYFFIYMYILLGIYIMYVIKSTRFSRREKLDWVAKFFAFSVVSMPYFWCEYIWKTTYK